MDMFFNVIYKEILEVFKDNKYLKPRLDFLGKYRHDDEYVKDIESKLNKAKEDIYIDCLLFTSKLSSFIEKASDEVSKEIENENKTRTNKVSIYGKQFMDKLCERVSEYLKKEGDFI